VQLFACFAVDCFKFKEALVRTDVSPSAISFPRTVLRTRDDMWLATEVDNLGIQDTLDIAA
jgi:hypothetical protein